MNQDNGIVLRLNSFKLFIIVFITVICCTSVDDYKDIIPEKISFETIFKEDFKIHIVGTADMPLHFVASLNVFDDRILITNPRINKIYIFDFNGNIISRFGIRGNNPGEFEFPHGGWINGSNLVYINDQENHRIQVMNELGKYLSSITVPYYTSDVFVLESPSRPRIVTVGGYLYRNKTYLIRSSTLDGKKEKYMAEIMEPLLISNNVATIDDNGDIYICNILLPLIRVYNSNGNSIQEFNLNSPSMAEFYDVNWAPDNLGTREGLIAIRQTLTTKSYLLVHSIHWVDSHLLFVLRRMNYHDTFPEYIVDVYRDSGHCNYYGITSDFPIAATHDGLVFFSASQDSLDYGALLLTAYRLQMP